MSIWRQLFTRRMLICVVHRIRLRPAPYTCLLNLLPAWLRTEHIDLKSSACSR